MKFLGIDYGTKRIGIAISDEGGVLAFPKEIILNKIDYLEKIKKIIEEEGIKEIIIGESTDFSGNKNIVSQEIDELSLQIKKLGFPVHKQKEFLTSVEARKQTPIKKGRSGAHSKIKKDTAMKVDSSAAALILQRYLDKINKIK